MTLIEKISNGKAALPTRRAGAARRMTAALLCALAIGVAGCSSSPDRDPNDRLESVNRKIYTFNDGLDTLFLEPIAFAYKTTVPSRARVAVDNQLRWASRPSTVVNSTIQGDFENAGLAALNFLVNGLTLGLADLTEDDEPVKSQDFGNTLAHYNVPQGDYLMVPILGPRTTRALIGGIVDMLLNPLGIIKGADGLDDYNRASTPVAAVNFRANIFEAFNDVKYNSIDPYARTRSLYLQTRAGGSSRDEEEESASDDEFDAFFDEETDQ